MTTRTRRLAFLAAPVAGLVVLSPLVGEYLLGNTPLTAIVALPFLAPLYGAGAVVVREVARRTGGGWPMILLLALAYGVLEEGVATQMLFNPHYAGAAGPVGAYLPGIGLQVLLTFQVLAMHTVWSIAVPIAVVEALVGEERRTAPWLGRAGLGVALAVLAGGVVLGGYSTLGEEHFLAAPFQFALAGMVIAGLVALAFVVGRRRRATPATPATGPVPHPLVVTAVALVLSSAYFGFSELPGTWTGIVVMTVLAAVATGLGLRYGRRAGWTDAHRFAAAAGALLTYCWLGLTQTPYRAALDATKTAGQVVLVVATLVLIAVVVRRFRRSSRSFADGRHGVVTVGAGTTSGDARLDP